MRRQSVATAQHLTLHFIVTPFSNCMKESEVMQWDWEVAEGLKRIDQKEKVITASERKKMNC